MDAGAERILNRLRMRHLRLVMEAARHGSLLAAAKALNLSQPAATKMLRDLELDLGGPLFERTNRGVVPTDAGAAVVRHSTLIMTQMSRALEELSALSQGQSGLVRVGTLLAASAQLLPQAIIRLRSQAPGVSVKVVEGTSSLLINALTRGDVDVVVGRLPVLRHGDPLLREMLTQDHLSAVVRPGHPLAERSRLDLNALSQFEWILPPSDTTLRRQLDQLFANEDVVPPRSFVESVNYLTNRALVTRTNMIWVLPGEACRPDLQNGLLHPLDWRSPIGNGPVGITLRRDDAPAPATTSLLAALRHVATRDQINAVDSQGQ